MSKRNFTARSDEVEFVFTAFFTAAGLLRHARDARGALLSPPPASIPMAPFVLLRLDTNASARLRGLKPSCSTAGGQAAHARTADAARCTSRRPRRQSKRMDTSVLEKYAVKIYNPSVARALPSARGASTWSRSGSTLEHQRGRAATSCAPKPHALRLLNAATTSGDSRARRRRGAVGSTRISATAESTTAWLMTRRRWGEGMCRDPVSAAKSRVAANGGDRSARWRMAGRAATVSGFATGA